MADKRIKGITIEIGGDTSKLDKALSGVNKTLRDSQAELKDINKLLKLDPGNTDLLKQKYEALTKSVDATKEKLQTLKTAQEQAAQALAKGDISQAQYDNLQREIIETEHNLESLTKEYKEFGSVSRQEIKNAGDNMKELGGKVSDAGKKLSVVSGGIAAVGGATIAAAKELDTGYDTIITKTGATGEAFDALKEVADTVFTSLPTDMDTVGVAVGEVNTRFHVMGDELGDLSSEFIKFAEINGTDLNTAIDSVDSIMRKFNVDTSDTKNVLGLFTKASQDSGISIETLESSLEKNGASLKELGLGLTESVNLLSMLEANGVDTSIAMAGLKKAVQEAAKEGISADEAITQTVESIKNAKSETEALQMATELFGAKGAAEMYQAIREGRVDIDSLSASISDYGDVVTNTFDATQDPWDEAQTAMNKLKLTGAELGSTLLTTLGPSIEKLINKVGEVAKWFGNLSDGQKKAIVTVGLVVAAIGPLVTVIGTLITAGGTLLGIIAGISAPVLAVAAAIAAVIAIGVALYKNWDTIKEKAGELKENLSNKWEEMKTNTSQKWEEMKQTAKDKWNEMKDNVKNSKIGVAAGETLEAAKATVKEKLDNIKKAYEDHGGGIKGVVSGYNEAIKGYWTAGLTFIDKLTDGKLTDLKNKTKEKYEEIKTATAAKWEEIKTNAANKAEEIKTTTAAKWENLKTTTATKWEEIKKNTATKWEEMKQSIANSKLADVVGHVVKVVKDTFFEKFDNIKRHVINTVDSIKEKFDNLKLKLPDIKLPHFKIDGELSLNPPKVPKLSIDWYAKAMQQGMILNSPTIFGAAGGRLLGAGEAGAEAVVGVGSLQSMIQNAVGSSGINAMVSLMQQYLPYLAEGTEIRLDTGALVGNTVRQMNSALGQISAREARR